jgi:hypothetical protein
MPSPQRLRGWLLAIIASVLMGGGVARAQFAVPEAPLDTFLGLNPPSGFNTGALTNLGNGPVMNGSAIMQTITVSAGTTLTFDYNFLTNAPPPITNPLGALDPFAFVTQPTLTDFVDNFYGYPTPMTPAPASTGFLYQTGTMSFSETFATAGTYNFGVGVVDVTTDQYSSALTVTNFALSAGSFTNGSFSTGDFSGWSTIGNTSVVAAPAGLDGNQALISTASVPEPSSIVLLIMGGLGAAVVIRKAKATSTPWAA